MDYRLYILLGVEYPKIVIQASPLYGLIRHLYFKTQYPAACCAWVRRRRFTNINEEWVTGKKYLSMDEE
jgi:hypothetical protein